jgi:hypothetical protein
MRNKYEDPTVRLVASTWSEDYKKNYEAIFGKKETWLERRERERKELLALPPVQLELPLEETDETLQTQ